MAFSGDFGKVAISSTAGDSLSGRFVIDNIRWAEGVAAGDEAIIKDSSGNIIFQAKISVANVDVVANYQDGLFIDGIDIDTLGSGKVLITMR